MPNKDSLQVAGLYFYFSKTRCPSKARQHPQPADFQVAEKHQQQLQCNQWDLAERSSLRSLKQRQPLSRDRWGRQVQIRGETQILSGLREQLDFDENRAFRPPSKRKQLSKSQRSYLLVPPHARAPQVAP